MPRGSTFISSSIGTKILIALTGLALFGFLIAHLAGNLLVFVSPAAFNDYAHKLVSNPLIYLAEAGLAALFVLHVLKAVHQLDLESARPSGGLRAQAMGRPRQPQELGLDDDDRERHRHLRVRRPAPDDVQVRPARRKAM